MLIKQFNVYKITCYSVNKTIRMFIKTQVMKYIWVKPNHHTWLIQLHFRAKQIELIECIQI